MKIKNHRTKNVASIKCGVAFDFAGDIFIKTRDYHDVNAVDLKTGFLFHINPDQEVTIYDAKVVLE